MPVPPRPVRLAVAGALGRRPVRLAVGGALGVLGPLGGLVALITALLAPGCSTGTATGAPPSRPRGPSRAEVGVASASGASTASGAPDARPGGPLLYTPAARSAKVYEELEESSAPGSPLAEAAFAALRDHYARTGRPPPLYDRRLEAVASEYARIFPDEGAPPRDLADFVLRHVGIAEPFPHIAVYTLASLDPPAFGKSFAGDLGALVGDRKNRRFALGVAPLREGAGYRVVVTFLPGILLLDPVPRAIAEASKASVTLRGRLLGSDFRTPHVVVTRPDGTVKAHHDLALTGDGLRFSVKIPLDRGAGRYELEVVAEGAHGPAVVALLPVYTGAEPPGTIAIRAGSAGVRAESAVEAERTVLALVNEARAAAGLRPVAWSEAAAIVARAHSSDMAAHGFLGHSSPTTGTPEMRAVAAALRHSSPVEENVAKAYTALDAHEGLMASPGHRGVVLTKSATHLGVGIFLNHRPGEPPAYFVTELFVRDMPPVDPARAAREVVDLVNDARARAGVMPLRHDAELARLAARGCEDHMKLGRSAAATSKAIAEGFPAVSAPYGAIATVLSHVPYLEAVLGSPELADARFVGMGVGAFEGKHATEGAGICVAILLGARR